MASKRAASEVFEEESASNRTAAECKSTIIKLWDADNKSHQLNWTALLKRAPKTCLRRAFDTRGEQVDLRQHSEYPGWFLDAVCKYADEGDALVIARENRREARQILKTLCWLAEEESDGEIAINSWDNLFYEEAPQIVVSEGVASDPDYGTEVVDSPGKTGCMMKDLINDHNKAVKKQLDELQRKAATMAVALLNCQSCTERKMVYADTIGISMDTQQASWNDANMARRFYCTLKQLGSVANQCGLFTYCFKATVVDSDGFSSRVEGRVYDVNTNPRFSVSFQLLLKQYEQ